MSYKRIKKCSEPSRTYVYLKMDPLHQINHKLNHKISMSATGKCPSLRPIWDLPHNILVVSIHHLGRMVFAIQCENITTEGQMSLRSESLIQCHE